MSAVARGRSWVVSHPFASRKMRFIPKRRGIKRQRVISYVARGELKYAEALVLNAAAVPSGGLVFCINQMAEGNEFNQRIGRAIRGKYIQVEAWFNPPTLTPNIDTGLMSLVYDKQPNNAAVAYAQIYDATAGLHLGMQFKQIAVNKDRFKIVRTWVLGPSNIGDLSSTRVRAYYPIGKSKSIVRFVSNASAVPQTGAWLLAVASVTNSDSAVTSLNGIIQTRFAYTDV